MPVCGGGSGDGGSSLQESPRAAAGAARGPFTAPACPHGVGLPKHCPCCGKTGAKKGRACPWGASRGAGAARQPHRAVLLWQGSARQPARGLTSPQGTRFPPWRRCSPFAGSHMPWGGPSCPGRMWVPRAGAAKAPNRTEMGKRPSFGPCYWKRSGSEGESMGSQRACAEAVTSRWQGRCPIL